jgi:hypothetical protein
MIFPLAHVGHWLAELMYVAPVVVIVGWLSVRALLDRRRERAEEEEHGGQPAG